MFILYIWDFPTWINLAFFIFLGKKSYLKEKGFVDGLDLPNLLTNVLEFF